VPEGAGEELEGVAVALTGLPLIGVLVGAAAVVAGVPVAPDEGVLVAATAVFVDCGVLVGA
jgi:hypothetical protein